MDRSADQQSENLTNLQLFAATRATHRLTLRRSVRESVVCVPTPPCSMAINPADVPICSIRFGRRLDPGVETNANVKQLPLQNFTADRVDVNLLRLRCILNENFPYSAAVNLLQTGVERTAAIEFLS
jgi:hypothetical protein